MLLLLLPAKDRNPVGPDHRGTGQGCPRHHGRRPSPGCGSCLPSDRSHLSSGGLPPWVLGPSPANRDGGPPGSFTCPLQARLKNSPSVSPNRPACAVETDAKGRDLTDGRAPRQRRCGTLPVAGQVVPCRLRQWHASRPAHSGCWQGDGVKATVAGPLVTASREAGQVHNVPPLIVGVCRRIYGSADNYARLQRPLFGRSVRPVPQGCLLHSVCRTSLAETCRACLIGRRAIRAEQ